MKRGLFLVCCVLLVGCPATPLKPSTTPATKALWKTHQEQLGAIKAWHLNARIGIVTQRENWTANVHWQQNPLTYTLIFKAPLGQSTMSLTGDPRRVVMRTTDGEEIEESNPDVLIAKVLELPIPVTGLYFWIRGIPSPHPIPKYQLNEAGYLYSLQQDGWDIAYKRYTEIGDIALPEVIFLENQHFEVRIAVSQWDL